jgi:hypothetical protein
MVTPSLWRVSIFKGIPFLPPTAKMLEKPTLSILALQATGMQ